MCKHLPLSWVAWKPIEPHNGQSFSVSKALKIKRNHVSTWTALILFFQQRVNFCDCTCDGWEWRPTSLVTQLTTYNSTDLKGKKWKNGTCFFIVITKGENHPPFFLWLHHVCRNLSLMRNRVQILNQNTINHIKGSLGKGPASIAAKFRLIRVKKSELLHKQEFPGFQFTLIQARWY